ncbi:hypothetical protein BDP27DRAFT_1311013 [Rhodocollybia butyracea]|uniref:FHA domain-containing protein n=1 Tax=Rhodocollybia butyracea TaxID=206335 RepID=A0A9P5QAS4_9AGAR|nr:hypothetical protein BDP27DRAFT_1311013 [Rhodocollybia butyracea]
MKQNELDVAVTAFGIDSDLTFGQDRNCGVRLCYPDVSPIHCKITFDEGKAFLIVLGTHGLLVDGCRVFASSSASSPNTIPLANNSEIEIRGKRFRFTYPPKEIRAQLLSTPTLPRRRALRLSMIESAEVFSPRPSPNPLENLRVLQTPLKPYHIRSQSSSPLKFASPSGPLFSATMSADSERNDDDEEEIILVEGNCPRVVEEEKDLIILEDVEVPLAPAPSTLSPRSSSKSPTKPQYVPAPPPMLLPPQPPITPRRPRPTLHKAVLIRSAHRAIMQAEIQREEEELDQEEEAEVFGAILGDDDEESDAENEPDQNDESSRPAWKASLERIWPFRRSTSPTRAPSNEERIESILTQGEPMDVDQVGSLEHSAVLQGTFEPTDSVNDAKDEVVENPAPLYPRLDTSLGGVPSHGYSNNPQTQRQEPRSSSVFPDHPRMSLGGGEARRVKVEEYPWKVQDLVVPTPPASPTRPSKSSIDGETTPSGNQLSEAERRAIQERRRSAVRMSGNFFPGGAPGLAPSSPVKKGEQASMKQGRVSISAVTKEDQLDTRSLLEKMKDKVEGIKAERRASIAVSPQKRRFSETPAPDNNEEFSLLRSPSKQAARFSSVLEEPEPHDVVDPIISPPEAVISSDSGPAVSPGHSDVGDVQIVHAAVTVSPIKTRTARNKTVLAKFVDTPSLADDEASPDVVGRMVNDSDDEQPTKVRGKILRGTGKVPGGTSKGYLKPPSKARSTAKVTVETSSPEAPSEAEATQPKAQPSTARRPTRSRSKTPNPQPSLATTEGTDNQDHAAVPRPTRKALRAVEDTDTRAAAPEEQSAAPAKRTGKAPRTRSRSRAPDESETEASSKATDKPLSRTTRSRGKTPVSELETDEETTHIEEAAVAKPKRGRRPKTPAVPEVIKEEVADEVPATTTKTRAKKAVSISDSGPKPRSKKADSPAQADIDKENEDARVSAGEDEPVVTKTRIGRLRKAPVAKVKEETQTEPEIGGARTRGMRTRSKT